MSFLLLALGLLAMAPATGSATGPATPAAGAIAAEQAAQDFLRAFNAMDEVRFAAFFDEEATMFFRAGPFPKERIEGKTAVVAAFSRFFAMARDRGMAKLDIQPLDLRVQDLGKVAIISFELRGNGNIGRRSIVMQRAGAAWHIVHFHASALELAPAS